ncbi:MAG TPA: A24 family peptidase [Armatimonadota bacterium]|nr:A24 family peptidase [Armatimonadota bacterium]HOM72536.1 A24 family peptidase [Armatimonadota bacterium]
MLMRDVMLVVVLSIAVFTDVRTGKIKNWLTFPAIVSGPVVNWIDGGMPQAMSSLAGLAVMVLVGAVLAILKITGGGDIKLLVAVGSLVGMPLVAESLAFSAFAGGLLAIAVLIKQRRALSTTKQVAQQVWMRVGLGIEGAMQFSGRTKIPYSIAIAAGSIAALFWKL